MENMEKTKLPTEEIIDGMVFALNECLVCEIYDKGERIMLHVTYAQDKSLSEKLDLLKL